MHNDAWLVSRAALLGDKKAFCRLVEAYQSPIRRLFYHLTGDEELSKDLAQDTFIKVWINIGSFRAAAKFSTWLYRIAYNVFCDYGRTKKPSATVDVDKLSNKMKTDTSGKDFGIDFEHALRVLKDEERVAMLLFYMEDQTVVTISKMMNCPANTVKSYLHRGREKISKYFNHYE